MTRQPHRLKWCRKILGAIGILALPCATPAVDFPVKISLAEPGEEPEPEESWIDRSHKTLSEQVISSGKWFDSFFGDERAEEEIRGTRIRLRSSVRWEEGGDVSPRLGVNGKFSLPNLDDRVQIVIDSLASDDGDLPAEEFIRTAFRDIEDDFDLSAATRLLIGDTDDALLDLDLGLKFHSDRVSPFVKFRGRKLSNREKLVLRWSQFFFWESDDGFGETSRFDLDVRPTPDRFFRSTTQGTWSEFSHGVDLVQRFSVYQHFDQRQKAIGLAVAALATTDPDEFTEFQASIKYRQRLWRDWLFFEVEPEAIFPEERDYKFSPRLNVRFDIIYGDYQH